MVLEKRFRAVSPQLLTADGGTRGEVSVDDTCLFKVKQKILLNGSGLDTLELEVKRIESDTLMLVGPRTPKMTEYKDISAYTTAAASFIIANEQSRPKIPFEEFMRAVYSEEPVSALRNVLVDKYGKYYETSNPLPVQLSDGSINVGTVNAEVEVQLSRRDNFPDAGDVHDSTRIGNQDYELTFTANDDESKAAADIVALNKLIDVPHDDIEITQFTLDGDPEIIEFRDNSNLKLTLNLTYNSEGELQRVQRSKP